MSAYDYFERRYGLRQLILKYSDLIEQNMKAYIALSDAKYFKEEVLERAQGEEKRRFQKQYDERPKVEELARKFSELGGRLEEVMSEIEPKLRKRRQEFDSHAHSFDAKRGIELTPHS
jgi:hypothetical protein